MALSRKLMAGGLAAIALLATAGSAFAAPAYATGNVNVRSGPGTHYGIVDALRRGEQVDVIQCRGNWCYVEKRGPDGWVSANYLTSGRAGHGWDNGPRWDDNPGWHNPPPVYNPPRPPRPPHWNPRPSHPQPWPVHPGYNSGASVCFNGPNGYFCVGN